MAFRNDLIKSFQRIGTVYQCQRSRDKDIIEIIVEGVAKVSRNKRPPSIVTKIFSREYHTVGESTLPRALKDGVSLEQILERKRLIDANFFVDSMDESLWENYKSRFPDKCCSIIDDANKILRHEFDLLGSGPRSWGTPIDWHVDPTSGYRWPKAFYTDLLPVESLNNDADVKLPWELSRLQHLPTVGKAYGISRDEVYSREIVAQITEWLAANPCQIGVNWTCAMEVAIRAVNIVWSLVLIEGSPCVTRDFRRLVLGAIWQHGRYLVRHLEYSVRPQGKIRNHNHYISDIVGLVYLGLLFSEFKAAQTWLRIGIEGILGEMESQVYGDGVDYESSTSYHRLVLELFTSAALLCRLNRIGLTEAFWTRLEKMYLFTMNVTRPDGKVPQVGDSDDGRLYILSDYGRWDRMDHRYLLSIGAVLFQRPEMKACAGDFSEDAFWLLGSDGAAKFDALPDSEGSPQSAAFCDAGFYVMRSADCYLLACCNPVGTAGSGNHKHNDFLSFELFVCNRPFIVDPGTYLYTSSKSWRNHFRSTRSHNTIVIDGEEQNRLKKDTIFSLHADGETIIHRWLTSGDYDALDAEHTGYHRLACPVTHRRNFHLNKRNDTVRITDALTGVGEHCAEWYFHFDHGVDVDQTGDSVFHARSGDVTLQIEITSTLSLKAVIEEGWVSRSYGTKLPAKVLRLVGKFADHCKLALLASWCANHIDSVGCRQ
jgi:hypothetical protein